MHVITMDENTLKGTSLFVKIALPSVLVMVQTKSLALICVQIQRYFVEMMKYPNWKLLLFPIHIVLVENGFAARPVSIGLLLFLAPLTFK